MTVKVFLTGVTGYVGGDAFYALHEAHPEYEFTLLVRNEEKARSIKEKYPDVKIAYGDLNSSDVIEKAAAEADIVVHTADSSDHVPAATAIAKGLTAGHTPEKPGYWLHISGTGILMWYDESNKRYGQSPLPEQAYDDIKDIDRLINLPDIAWHRDVDKIVLAANSPAVRTAILCPPTIYGPGRGPGNQRSQQAYNLAKEILQRGYIPIVGTGTTEWDNVHVHDLSALFVLLADASRDPARASNDDILGSRAYYFVEHGHHVWGDLAHRVANEVVRQGFVTAPEPKTVTIDDVPEKSWGKNSKGTASRARKFLGWEPKGRSLDEELPDIVASEAKALGLTPKH